MLIYWRPSLKYLMENYKKMLADMSWIGIIIIWKEGNAFSINNIEHSNMNLTKYSIKRPQKLLAETGSTMHRTIKRSPSSAQNKRCSIMF